MSKTEKYFWGFITGVLLCLVAILVASFIRWDISYLGWKDFRMVFGISFITGFLFLTLKD